MKCTKGAKKMYTHFNKMMSQYNKKVTDVILRLYMFGNMNLFAPQKVQSIHTDVDDEIFEG